MKTAISVPDDVFDRAERTAKRLQLSRSELYSRALAEYLDRHTPDELTVRIDEAIEAVGQPVEPLVGVQSRRILGASEW